MPRGYSHENEIGHPWIGQGLEHGGDRGRLRERIFPNGNRHRA
jgi:hypothetical protein